MKIGNIVYKVRKGGFIHDEPIPIRTSVGLIIKEYREKGAIPQFYVKFDKQNPEWYYQHDLHIIGGERNEND
jgi:hypothetical protein